jgi:hypothetical protein
MNCQILRTLYVKANGIIPCEDNCGEWITLGNVSLEPGWSISGILEGPNFDHLRKSFAGQKLPWATVCDRCALIRPYQEIDDSIARRYIEKLQIETALTCALRCPCCSSLGQLKLRSKPFIMNLDLFKRLLWSCADEGYKIHSIEYCGQGEPLMHPKFAEFVRTAREIHPTARQRLVTNANYDYTEKVCGQYIEEIYVSCDGVFQKSYEQYRRGGSVDKALKFMRDAAAITQSKRPSVVWKYILFEFNDSEEELRLAQQIALDTGVEMLMFVLTQSDFQSRIYTKVNFPEILLCAPNARLSMTPDFFREEENDRPEQLDAICAGVDNGIICCHIDHIRAFPGIITLHGWAVACDPADEIVDMALTEDGQRLGSGVLGILRPDVQQYFQRSGRSAPRNAGFALSARCLCATPYPRRVDFHIRTKNGAVGHIIWSAAHPNMLDFVSFCSPYWH